MLNQIVLAGRLTSNPVVEMKDGKEWSKIIVAVPRSYKNVDGIYETDFIPVILHNSIAQTTAEYCKSGDVVGVKGRLQTTKKENVDGYDIEIIAEKISFLSSKSKDED